MAKTTTKAATTAKKDEIIPTGENKDLNQGGEPGEGGTDEPNEKEQPDETGEGTEQGDEGTEQTGDENSGQENAKEAKPAAPAKPAAQKPTVKAVDPVFKANPKLDVYYRAADGTPFYTENAARLHAVKLDNKEIKKITKG